MPRAREAQRFLRIPYRQGAQIRRQEHLRAAGPAEQLAHCRRWLQSAISRPERRVPLAPLDQRKGDPLRRWRRVRAIPACDIHAVPATSRSGLSPWVLLVCAMQWVWCNQLDMPEIADKVRPIIEEDARRLTQGLDLQLYAISVAQHYGLPTMGLDVTEDLRTALFFCSSPRRASTEQPDHRLCAKGVRENRTELVCAESASLITTSVSLARRETAGPNARELRFMVTGWGYHRNAVARHLGMALDLDPAGDFGSLPTAAELFPERGEDLFGSYLEQALDQGLPSELKEICRAALLGCRELMPNKRRLVWVRGLNVPSSPTS